MLLCKHRMLKNSSWCAGGDVQWSDGVSPDLPTERSIEDLKNHYDRHTKYCSACQKVHWKYLLAPMHAVWDIADPAKSALHHAAQAACSLEWFDAYSKPIKGCNGQRHYSILPHVSTQARGLHRQLSVVLLVLTIQGILREAKPEDDLQAIRRLDQISKGIVALSAALGGAAAFAVPASAGFGVFGLQVQWRLLVGALALALLSLRGPVLSFRQRFFSADDIIG